MPVYKGRKPGTWRVIIHANKRNHEWVVPGLKSEAKSFEALKRVELDVVGLSKRVSPTFEEFCISVYIPHAKQHLKETTWKRTKQYQVTTLCLHFGRLKLSAIDSDHVDAFKRARNATQKPNTTNSELRAFATILNFARGLGYPTTSTKIKMLKLRAPSRVKVWTADEVRRLFEACNPKLLPLVVFLVNTGCRKGEAIAAEWSWIDEQAMVLRIPSNDVWTPKSGKPREVPLSPALLAALPPRTSKPWIFLSRHGGRFRQFPLNYWEQAIWLAELEGTPHQLRHTYASHFLAAVPDMFLLANVLGHSHATTTAIYSHLLADHLDRARGAVALMPKNSAGALATPRATSQKRRATQGKRV